MKYVEIKSLFRESEKYDGQKISVERMGEGQTEAQINSDS